MQSESARATTAAEARYRIDTPNSRQRSMKIIALDPRSEKTVARLAREEWNGASFLTASRFSGTSDTAPTSMRTWLSDLAGRAKDLVDEVATADSVVMIGSVGEDTEAAAMIAETCSLRGVMTTVLLLGSSGEGDERLNAALARLRPSASMLVIANDESYLIDMLTALRA